MIAIRMLQNTLWHQQYQHLSELPITSTSKSRYQNKTSISEPSTGYNQLTEPSKAEGIIIYTDDSVNVPSELTCQSYCQGSRND